MKKGENDYWYASISNNYFLTAFIKDEWVKMKFESRILNDVFSCLIPVVLRGFTCFGGIIYIFIWNPLFTGQLLIPLKIFFSQTVSFAWML